MSRYTYPTSLNATRIRLLRFDNDSINENELRILMTEYPLSNIPPYHALSYTWGPPREKDRNYQESDKVPITLNEERFDVFPNLYHALHQLRFHEFLRSEYFWVDAICINQTDIPEREFQVDTMDQIYKKAVQVNIWLGEEDGTCAKVLRLVAKIGGSWTSVKEDINSGRSLTRLSNVGDNESLRQYDLPPWTNEIWVLFINFFRRSWFRRVWIIQETALAKETRVMLGKSIIDWSYVVACSNFLRHTGLAQSLYNYATRIGSLNNDHQYPTADYQVGATIGTIDFAQISCRGDAGGSEYNGMIQTLDAMLKYRTAVKSERPLLFLYVLLYLTREFRCSDARDRVFALLGMVNCLADMEGLPRLPFRSNYGTSSTSAIAFMAVTKAILEHFQLASILTLANNSSGHAVTSLPSWVPDFSLKGTNPILRINLKRSGNSEFDPSKYKSLGQLGLRVEDQRLCLKAFQIDVVKQQTRSWADMLESTHCEDLASLVLSCPSTYAATGQNRIEVLWRTIIYDTGKTTSPAEPDLHGSFRYWLAQRIITGISWSTPTWSERVEVVKSLANLEKLASSDSSQTIPALDLLKSCVKRASEIPFGHRNFRDESTLGVEKTLLRGMMAYEELANLCTAGRLVFVTEKGYLGSGPESMEICDTVWVVSGCSSLLVFREHPSDPTCYQLAGEAYIHGLMLGEAVKGDTQWKEICLL